MSEDPQGYGRDYSEQGFRDKLLGYARMAGEDVIGKALELYYALQSPETPGWAKTVIIGALGYFINIIDAVPDMTPIIGYTDDLGVLAAALATVARHITPEVRQQAEEKLKQWFG